MKIYIGNLSRDITEDEVRQEFAAFGAVDSVALIKDKFTGQLKGFGFVEMPVRTEAEAALAGLNDKEIKGRKATVNEARPMTDRHSGGGDRRGGSSGGGGNRRSGGSGGGSSSGGGRRSW
jgi:RNA recognition motif-containing protein